jgi:hypothetical protein
MQGRRGCRENSEEALADVRRKDLLESMMADGAEDARLVVVGRNQPDGHIRTPEPEGLLLLRERPAAVDDRRLMPAASQHGGVRLARDRGVPPVRANDDERSHIDSRLVAADPCPDDAPVDCDIAMTPCLY